jgi:hypothetical protein
MFVTGPSYSILVATKKKYSGIQIRPLFSIAHIHYCFPQSFIHAIVPLYIYISLEKNKYTL